MALSLGKFLVASERTLLPAAVLLLVPSLWATSLLAQEVEVAPVEEGRIQATFLITDGEKSKEEGEYWIGLACAPVGGELRDKLKLEKGNGLVIEQVLPDSPAAKAGLKSEDVIIAFGTRKLRAATSINQLAEVIAEAKGDVLKLEYLRQGERKTVEIRPAKREGQGLKLVLGEQVEEQQKLIKKLRQQLEELQKSERAQREKAEAAKAEAHKQAEEAKAAIIKADAMKKLQEAKGAAAKAEAEARKRAEEAKAATESAQAEAFKRLVEAKAAAAKAEATKEGKGEAPRVEHFKLDGKDIIIKMVPGHPMPGQLGGPPHFTAPAHGPHGHAPHHGPGAPHTGVFVPGGAHAFTVHGHAPALPDDMSVSISKQGKQPATIVVEQGSKMWKTTENELEMLPAEARAYAARILGKHGPTVFGSGGATPGTPAGGGGFGVIGHGPTGAPHGKAFELKLKVDGEKKAEDHKPADKAEIRWLELKRPEPSPEAKKNAEAETRELTEKLHQLRRQLEELRKAADEKKK